VFPPRCIEHLHRTLADWIWDDLEVTGEADWVLQAIQDGTCTAVCDGSFMPDLVPNACSAAVILECSRGRGTISGSFVERSTSACAYRGEMMGLMAIHLILEGSDRVRPNMTGGVSIHSDCLGAIGMVEHVPSSRIPTRCKHADILKTIMVNCQMFPFSIQFHHVRAHQDEVVPFHQLNRPAQLNCLMDAKAKAALMRWARKEVPPQQPFPLEPITVYAGQDKITGDCGDIVSYWAHRQLARKVLAARKIMDPSSFDKVDWVNFRAAIHSTPRLFQVWASKQIAGIAHTNKFQARIAPGSSPLCPSCQVEEETCAHIPVCPEKGRVDTFLRAVQDLDKWLESVYTEPYLRHIIILFARYRGQASMTEVCRDSGSRFRTLSYRQDCIGWRRFMEGMIPRDFVMIQQRYLQTYHIRGSAARWAQQLMVKLLECTHGQWLYRNIMIHDKWSGAHANARKEEIAQQIEEQFESETDLLEEHQYLIDINLGDISSGSGESQAYWLLAVQAARAAKLRADCDEAEGIG